MADVVAVNMDEDYKDLNTNQFLSGKAGLISYAQGFYFKQGEKIGKYGYSSQDHHSEPGNIMK